MNEMIKRVAEAIMETTDEAMLPDDAERCARAAIAAYTDKEDLRGKVGAILDEIRTGKRGL